MDKKEVGGLVIVFRAKFALRPGYAWMVGLNQAAYLN